MSMYVLKSDYIYFLYGINHWNKHFNSFLGVFSKFKAAIKYYKNWV